MSWLRTGTDPYRAAGVAANPFAWNDQGADPGPYMNRLLTAGVEPKPGQRRVIELVGVRGAGKTTQLRAWQALLGGPYHYVPPGPVRDRWVRPPIAPIVFWDEVDRMPRPVLRRALRTAARHGSTVIMGTHRSLASEARRADLSVLTMEFGPLDRDELARWAADRIERAALHPDAPVVPPAVIADVAVAADGSLRVAGDLLHRWFATQVDGPGFPNPARGGVSARLT